MAAMTEEEVESYRRKREITVEGRDVPKPVREFQDVGFPGSYCYSIPCLGLYLDPVFVSFCFVAKIWYDHSRLHPKGMFLL